MKDLNELSYTISPKEKSLLSQCLNDNRVAQRQLFVNYKDAMYTLLYRILDDEEEAKDALQETFIAVFGSLHTFRSQSTLGAWIKTIAIRTGIAIQKKQQDLYHTDLENLGGNEPIIWTDELTSETLAIAMSKLSPGYRTVFVLVEIEGYAHREVAEMMGINEGTSKSQLYHAKKSLQKMLKEYDYGGREK